MPQQTNFIGRKKNEERTRGTLPRIQTPDPTHKRHKIHRNVERFWRSSCRGARKKCLNVEKSGTLVNTVSENNDKKHGYHVSMTMNNTNTVDVRMTNNNKPISKEIFVVFQSINKATLMKNLSAQSYL